MPANYRRAALAAGAGALEGVLLSGYLFYVAYLGRNLGPLWNPGDPLGVSAQDSFESGTLFLLFVIFPVLVLIGSALAAMVLGAGSKSGALISILGGYGSGDATALRRVAGVLTFCSHVCTPCNPGYLSHLPRKELFRNLGKDSFGKRCRRHSTRLFTFGCHTASWGSCGHTADRVAFLDSASCSCRPILPNWFYRLDRTS